MRALLDGLVCSRFNPACAAPNLRAFLWGKGEVQIMRKSVLVCLFSVLTFLWAGQVCGQSSTGSIVGTVIDSQGLPIDSAAVTLTNVGTNSNYTSTTGSNGGYQFKSIDYGYYRVSV